MNGLRGWFPLCGNCVTADHTTVRTPEKELACRLCGAPSEYLAIDDMEYEELPRVVRKGEP